MIYRTQKDKFHSIALLVVLIIFVVYAFVLSYKRYTNFEYGKFDLGNMSQIVWNTSRGRFMEVTDQFGTNMPRWGMSHVDPILILFAPIYWFYDNPMILVLIQQIVVVSAIFPLFWLVRMKTESIATSYLVAASYLLYPAIGFTLVWTGFHGISFTAPLFVWTAWWLEKNNFLIGKQTRSTMFVYWMLIVLMLAGKEEIGAILSIFSAFLLLKNRKLAIQTLIVSFVWFFVSFFVIIPLSSGARQQSIQTFVEMTGINEIRSDRVAGENFFLSRYGYLGSSYGGVIKNFIIHPNKWFKVVFTKDKIQTLNFLLGPFVYVVMFVPVWIVSLPDLAIVMLSKDAIFNITNHRVAFVISSLFVSYVYLLQFVRFRFSKLKISIVAISFLVLLSSIYFSNMTNNPLYVSGKSFLNNKIMRRVFAAIPEEVSGKRIGMEYKAQIPRNDVKCLNQMVDIINGINPNIYTGPDYLGAQAANRRTNALFPARYWDADLIIVDIFETKSLGPFGDIGWTLNKKSFRKMLETRSYKHIYSCGKLSAFVSGNTEDTSTFDDDYVFPPVPDSYSFEVKGLVLKIYPYNVPKRLSKSKPTPIEIVLAKERGDFHDKATFWELRSPDLKFGFIDYLDIGLRQGLDQAPLHTPVVKKYRFRLPDDLPDGNYQLFFGAGDLLNAKKVYLGDVYVGK